MNDDKLKELASIVHGLAVKDEEKDRIIERLENEMIAIREMLENRPQRDLS